MSLSTGLVLEVDGSAIESLVSKDRYHHTLAATDTVTTRGKAGIGTLFNGTTSFVDCGNDASLNTGINDFTLEVWLKTNYDGTQVFLAKRKTYYYEITFDASNRTYLFMKGICNTADGVLDSRALNDGLFHHIIVVFDRDNDATAYIDNVIGDSPIDISGIGNVDNTGNLYIGAESDIVWFFNGTISSAKIYNYALSSTQIKRHYLEKAYLHVPHPVRIP